MNKSSNNFQIQSPKKILDGAIKYTETLKRHHELPKGMSKSMVVKSKAIERKDDVQFAIQYSKYQNSNFRKLESIDHERKSKIQKSLKDRDDKVVNNNESILQKKNKASEKYNKHVAEVYKKYNHEQKTKRANEKQEAYKLRKELLSFYQKQQQRKKNDEQQQVKVSSCYQSAVDRINNIHRQNQLYSLKAEEALKKQLEKNNHYDEIIKTKKRALSCANRSKDNIYERSMDNFYMNQEKYIQTYGQNEDKSIRALRHIEQDNEKQIKRINQFFKKRIEKWKQCKKRVNQQRAQIPDRCNNILDKTTKASFRKTVSSFHDSKLSWHNKVQQNKSMIKEIDEEGKDRIMNVHLDLRLKNHSNFKINEKMSTMRHQARKLANDYL